ncbi:MAG: hypothetical protein AAGC73_06735 [Verrucomicrobiota bacterium]
MNKNIEGFQATAVQLVAKNNHKIEANQLPALVRGLSEEVKPRRRLTELQP